MNIWYETLEVQKLSDFAQKNYAGASWVSWTAVASLDFSSVATGAVAGPIGWQEIYTQF